MDTPGDGAVRETLDRIVASPAFRASKQCQKFLRYVVEHSHAGEEELLRERVIGTEVFGRPADYDTAGDPVVRVRATEVRKRLSQYYAESAVEGDVRIEIPAGSYRAEVHPLAAPRLDAALAAPRKPAWWLAAAPIGLALAGLVVWMAWPRTAAAPGVLDRFWGPAVASSKPVFLYCGQPTVYFLAPEVRQRFRSPHPPHAVAIPPDTPLQGRDVVPVTDQFVGIGNAHTAALLSGWFAGRGKPVEIRYANDLSFSDLRGSPSVLIGAFSNLWTLEMTGKLRFVFEQEGGVRRIRDTTAKKDYAPAALAPDGKAPDDYGVVTRLTDSPTGQLLVSAAGITQYGTRAAGEFLADSGAVERLVAGAPRDWPRKNLQVLLHTTVYKGTPAPPRVLAMHAW